MLLGDLGVVSDIIEELADDAEEILSFDEDGFAYGSIFLLLPNITPNAEKWKKGTKDDSTSYQLYARAFGYDPKRAGNLEPIEGADTIVYSLVRKMLDDNGQLIVPPIKIDNTQHRIKVDNNIYNIVQVQHDPEDNEAILATIYCVRSP